MKFLLYAPLFQVAFSANECYADVDLVALAKYLPAINIVADSTTVCTCNSVVARNAGNVVLTKDGVDWDRTATANYELGNGRYAVNGEAVTSSCVGTNDGNPYFRGEEVVSGATASALCVCVSRKYYEDLGTSFIPQADKLKTKLVALTTEGDICNGKTENTPEEIDVATGRLKHMEDGDGTKDCINLPYESLGKVTCASTSVCDWFNEAANPCVVKTTVITDQWTAPTTSTNWCAPWTRATDQASPRAHRRTAAGDGASAACEAGEFCNWGRRGSDPVCIASADMLATMKTAARATGVAAKCCLSTVGAKVCTA